MTMTRMEAIKDLEVCLARMENQSHVEALRMATVALDTAEVEAKTELEVYKAIAIELAHECFRRSDDNTRWLNVEEWVNQKRGEPTKPESDKQQVWVVEVDGCTDLYRNKEVAFSVAKDCGYDRAQADEDETTDDAGGGYDSVSGVSLRLVEISGMTMAQYDAITKAAAPKKKTFHFSGYYEDNDQPWSESESGDTWESAQDTLVARLKLDDENEFALANVIIVDVVEGGAGMSLNDSCFQLYEPADVS